MDESKMTEDKIKEMLADIINNSSNYEYRWRTADGWSDWKSYKLGDKIYDTYEYRKVETWCVVKFTDYYSPCLKRLDGLTNNTTIYFEGTLKECEEWITEHTPKTWLEEEIKRSRLIKGEDIRVIAKVLCKKILEKVQEYCECTNELVGVDELCNIIASLGVEI